MANKKTHTLLRVEKSRKLLYEHVSIAFSQIGNRLVRCHVLHCFSRGSDRSVRAWWNRSFSHDRLAGHRIGCQPGPKSQWLTLRVTAQQVASWPGWKKNTNLTNSRHYLICMCCYVNAIKGFWLRPSAGPTSPGTKDPQGVWILLG